MREAPEGTVAYVRHGREALCTGCGAGTPGATPVAFESQSEGDAPLMCARCAKALGNRLSAAALDALVSEIRGWTGEPGEAGRLDALVEAYEDTLRESRRVDLLLTHDTGAVCLSDADTQRGLVEDLRDCDCAGDASHATRRVAEIYTVVAAPNIREGLVGRGYDADDLDDHALNVERAIWLFAWESTSADGEGDEEEPEGLEIELCMRGTGHEGERAQQLAQRARRATQAARASGAARAEARGLREGTTSVGERRRTEDGGTIVRAVWEIEAGEAEREEVRRWSEVPGRIGEALAKACAAQGATLGEVRTIHQPWRASVRAEATWAGG